MIYLGLGDKRRALDELEKAYEARSWSSLWLKVGRIFNPLRSEPRFITLMKRLKFDTSQRATRGARVRMAAGSRRALTPPLPDDLNGSTLKLNMTSF
jgi:hypothetical protein